MGSVAAADVRADAAAVRRWDGRVPILVGACGHRTISASDRLVGAIKSQCEALKKRYPNSPFIILSALAEGADRLIAKVAMKALGADLIAVLPMPAEEYERDFESSESREEFRALLTSALYVRIAAVPSGNAWKIEGEPRNEQYARAGAIIVDHAQVLFAIWDGKPARGTGGTADQVAWFERGSSPKKFTPYKDETTPLDPREPGRCVRIDPTGVNVSVADYPAPIKRRKSRIEQILEKTNKFNGNVKTSAAAIAESYPLVDEASVGELALTDAVYHAADGVSVRFANVVRNADAFVYVLAILAVVVFNFVSSKDWAPWTYLGITGVMAGLGLRILAPSLDNRFLEYRCLAEALRTLFFWRAAGVARPVWLPLLSRQSGTVHWIRQAVRTVEFCQDCLPCSHPELGSGSMSEGLRLAKEKWVDDQGAWFARKQAYHLGKYRFWSVLGYVGMAGSFATSGLIAALTVTHGASGETYFELIVNRPEYNDFWQAALSFFAAGTVAARGFLLRKAHLEIAKQYASQKRIFEKASGMLDSVKNVAAPEWTPTEILEKLGQEALQEQAEWVWLRHTRPFEVPAG